MHFHIRKKCAIKMTNKKLHKIRKKVLNSYFFIMKIKNLIKDKYDFLNKRSSNQIPKYKNTFTGNGKCTA